MKNLIQKYFMAIVAVMMMVGFSAYKTIENNKTDDPELETWYFNGEETEETDAEEYSRDQDPGLDCGDPETICEITAPKDPFNNHLPDLDHIVDPLDPINPTKTVRDYIVEAMNNPGTPNAVVDSFRKY